MTKSTQNVRPLFSQIIPKVIEFSILSRPNLSKSFFFSMELHIYPLVTLFKIQNFKFLSKFYLIILLFIYKYSNPISTESKLEIKLKIVKYKIKN